MPFLVKEGPVVAHLNTSVHVLFGQFLKKPLHDDTFTTTKCAYVSFIKTPLRPHFSFICLSLPFPALHLPLHAIHLPFPAFHRPFICLSLPLIGPSFAFPRNAGGLLKNIAVFSKGGWQKKGADYFTH